MDKRSRVKGDGPGRDKLKIFYKLGDVSKETVAELNNILEIHKHDDIKGDNYKISKTMCWPEHIGMDISGYRQVLLQSAVSEEASEYVYSEWKDDTYEITNTISDVSKFFEKVYRFRLSETKPGYSIDWHIDTDTSVACRAQICLSDTDSSFEFKNRSGVHQLKMKTGEMWFINTGWNHRVVANNDLRKVAIFTFKFQDLFSKDILYV